MSYLVRFDDCAQAARRAVSALRREHKIPDGELIFPHLERVLNIKLHFKDLPTGPMMLEFPSEQDYMLFLIRWS